ncbi:RND efflux system, inner membrane transporter CmeB [Klebsiella grimontii]|uniref:RND efflux system, inner membrane transporter CmeB n=1 Tax=Klebsiella grimontii TaxID=2058152 RepID=A0A7H4NU98_9ENTR|nr:RND efflux system, inner membrane transporter CmeB [Klebsiella grimontii]
MFSRFFVRRPVFAWVIAILIMLAGILAIRTLPVAQYPDVAPPAIKNLRHLHRGLRGNPGKQRHPGYRAAAHRTGQPALLYVHQQLRRLGQHYRHL